MFKKSLNLFLSIAIISIFANPVIFAEETEEDIIPVSIVIPMNYIDAEGNPVDELGNPIDPRERLTVSGSCGSVTITENSGWVTVIIRNNMSGLWNFSGQVTDSRTGSHYFSVDNFNNSYGYDLGARYGQRTLTLTGLSIGINGTLCGVSPGVNLNSYW